MRGPFIVSFYEEVDGALQYFGSFGSSELGAEVPGVGDCIVSPLSKRDFSPRNPDKHFAFEVVRRYFFPEVTTELTNPIKIMVSRRDLTDAERQLFFADGEAV